MIPLRDGCHCAGWQGCRQREIGQDKRILQAEVHRDIEAAEAVTTSASTVSSLAAAARTTSASSAFDDPSGTVASLAATCAAGARTVRTAWLRRRPPDIRRSR